MPKYVPSGHCRKVPIRANTMRNEHAGYAVRQYSVRTARPKYINEHRETQNGN